MSNKIQKEKGNINKKFTTRRVGGGKIRKRSKMIVDDSDVI